MKELGSGIGEDHTPGEVRGVEPPSRACEARDPLPTMELVVSVPKFEPLGPDKLMFQSTMSPAGEKVSDHKFVDDDAGM